MQIFTFSSAIHGFARLLFEGGSADSIRINTVDYTVIPTYTKCLVQYTCTYFYSWLNKVLLYECANANDYHEVLIAEYDAVGI